MLRCSAAAAWAWGDEGHEVIGLIAEYYLEPAVRARVLELLRQDDTGLVERDMAHESTWADKYRDSDRDGDKRRYLGTRDWHFVDLEITGLDVNRACYGRRPLAARRRDVPASVGPAEDCIVDKIDQFYAELKNPATDRKRSGASRCSSCCTWWATCTSRCTRAMITIRAAIASS